MDVERKRKLLISIGTGMSWFLTPILIVLFMTAGNIIYLNMYSEFIDTAQLEVAWFWLGVELLIVIPMITYLIIVFKKYKSIKRNSCARVMVN